jgi:hypothetical protein
MHNMRVHKVKVFSVDMNSMEATVLVDGSELSGCLEEGPDGYCIVTIDVNSKPMTITTEVPNVMLDVKRKPAACLKKPAAAPADDSDSCNDECDSDDEDVEDEENDYEEEEYDDEAVAVKRPAAVMARPAAQKVGTEKPKPPAKEATGIAAAHADAIFGKKEYAKMWYKNSFSFGIRQKFGEKRQIMNIGGKSCNKAKLTLERISDRVIDMMTNGGMSEADAKAQAAILVDGSALLAV